MFFPRLRRHAKWMFLFLALAFGLGFTLFGVGAGGVGVGDVFRDAGADGAPSVSDAENRVLDNPKDAEAFKELATAHQADGDLDGAIEAMQSYVQLRPKDADGFRELAALYLQQSTDAQQRAQIYQYRSAYLAPGAMRDTVFQIGGSPLTPDPITNAVSTGYESELGWRPPRRRPRPRRQSSSTRGSPSSSRTIRPCSSSLRKRRRPPATSRPRSPPTKHS